MFMLTCSGAVKTSGENFWPPDPNVAGADGEMSSVKSNDVSSTRSTPPSRMVASTTENGVDRRDRACEHRRGPGRECRVNKPTPCLDAIKDLMRQMPN